MQNNRNESPTFGQAESADQPQKSISPEAFADALKQVRLAFQNYLRSSPYPSDLDIARRRRDCAPSEQTQKP